MWYLLRNGFLPHRQLPWVFMGFTLNGNGGYYAFFKEVLVRLGSCFRRNDGFIPHLLEACYEAAQGVGHQAARQADVDQLGSTIHL